MSATPLVLMVLFAQLLSLMPAMGAAADPAAATPCEAYPIALPAAAFADKQPGDVITDLKLGTAAGNFGWVSWQGGPGQIGEPALVRALTPPGTSDEYVNPQDAADDGLSPGDWVASAAGVKASKGVVRAVAHLKTIDITVPLWDEVRGKGAAAQYHVEQLAVVRLTAVDLRAPVKKISARLVRLHACEGPDFVVGELSVEATASNRPLSLSVLVENAGSDASVTSQMHFYADVDPGARPSGPPVLTVEVEPLAAGQSLQLDHEWYEHGLTQGAHTLVAFVDATDAMVENREDNNGRSAAVTVGAPAPAEPLPAPPAEVPRAPEPESEPPRTGVGRVLTSGKNDEGQLGRTSTQRCWYHSIPCAMSFAPANLPVEAAEATGGRRSGMARGEDGSVWAWGWNGFGQLGDGTLDRSRSEHQPQQVPGLAGIVDIDSGAGVHAAVDGEGAVWLWGYTGGNNVVGDMSGVTPTHNCDGYGDPKCNPSPTKVAGLPPVKQVTVGDGGYGTYAAVTTTGELWLWGVVDRALLDHDTPVLSPARVDSLPSITSISIGGRDYGDHIVAVDASGWVWTWGNDFFGQLGRPGSEPHDFCPARECSRTPAVVPGLSGVTAVAAGENITMALRDDGSVWTWGRNYQTELGVASSDMCPHMPCARTPVQVPLAHPAIAIAINSDLWGSSQLVSTSNGVYGWGYNTFGQLGLPGTTRRPGPTLVSGLTDVIALDIPADYSLAIQASEAQTSTCEQGVVPDAFIVGVRDGADAQQTADALAQALGLTVTYVYPAPVNGFAARIPADKVGAVEGDPRIDAINPDRYMCPAATAQPQTASFGLQRIGASDDDVGQTLVGKGAGTTVAVIDSGVDATHPDLAGAVAVEPACVPGGGTPVPHEHGTAVAGVIAARDNAEDVVGVAPQASIISLSVADADGKPRMSSVICAVNWASEHASQVDVVNISLGDTLAHAPGTSSTDCSNADGDMLHKAVCHSVHAGVPYVVAAGNEAGPASLSIPAAYDEVITVASLADGDGAAGGAYPWPIFSTTTAGVICESADDELACSSNYGPEIDIHAPGTNVETTAVGGGTTVMDGTSFAAPFVAGAVALFKEQRPDATPDEVRQHLTDTWELGPVKNKNQLNLAGVLYLGTAELYVGHENGNLDRFDSVSGAKQKTIELRPRVGDVTAAPDMRHLYLAQGKPTLVSLGGTVLSWAPTGALAVLDTVDDRVVGTAPLNMPEEVAVSKDGRYAAVIDSHHPFGSRSLHVFDVSNPSVPRLLGRRAYYGPGGLVFSRDSRFLYSPELSDEFAPDGSRTHETVELRAIDLSSLVVVDRVTISRWPVTETLTDLGKGVVANTDGSRLYAVDGYKNELIELSAFPLYELRRVSLGSGGLAKALAIDGIDRYVLAGLRGGSTAVVDLKHFHVSTVAGKGLSNPVDAEADLRGNFYELGVVPSTWRRFLMDQFGILDTGPVITTSDSRGNPATGMAVTW